MEHIINTIPINSDGDGIVTKKEMESYIKLCLREKDEEVEKIQKAYDELYKKHTELLQQISEEKLDDINKHSNISDVAIQNFVDGLLADPNVNIYGFPDAIEAAVYRNVIRMVLGGVEDLFNKVSIDLMGHKITVVMEPYE